METNWRTYMAIEELNNNTICVFVEGNAIRNMKHREDINERLVYVSNIDPEPYLHKPINKHDLCRCVEVSIIAKEYI